MPRMQVRCNGREVKHRVGKVASVQVTTFTCYGLLKRKLRTETFRFNRRSNSYAAPNCDGLPILGNSGSPCTLAKSLQN